MAGNTPLGICNMALDKLSADPLSSIESPTKPNEKLFSRLYPQYKRSELRKHRWLFALQVFPLTPTGSPIVNAEEGTLYRYTMPGEALRAVRTPDTTWQVRGRELLDVSSTSIVAKFVMNASEDKFDPLFEEALACQLAINACYKITQSNDKKESLTADYRRAIDDAKRSNALELGPESIEARDDKFDWLNARNI